MRLIYFRFFVFSFKSFSHQRQLMVSHWSLSDSKSPQIPRTVFNVLANLNNAVVWMVSTRSVITQVLQFLYQPFIDCTERAIYNWYHRHFHVLQFFSIPWPGPDTYPSFHILSILFCGRPGQQSRQFCKFSFFFFLLIIIRSGRLVQIRDPCCCCCCYYYHYLLIRVFHISVSWWFFTGVWVTASLLKSPRLFSLFWLFSIML